MLKFALSGFLIFGFVSAADLPVQTVILYKHGVGYLERGGTLAAGETARLEFKAAEMNDVLKSLTVQDTSGAKVTGLRYDSSNPVSQRLADFPFQLPAHPAISSFLNQMRGARIEVRMGQDAVQGSIVSARLVAASPQAQEFEQVVLLLDSGELRQVSLSAASGIRFTDPALQTQMREYFRIVADGRSTDKRSVYLDSTDSKSRPVRASYMIPVAVWKSSYRLIFSDTGEPTLEGWAIVDNTTGDDWTKIKLSLVSGRPISFISELYEPRYKNRPRVELEEEASAAPVVHQGAMRDGTILAAGSQPPAADQLKRLNFTPNTEITVNAKVEPLNTSSSVAVATSGEDRGELFEYSFSTPVTIRRNEFVDSGTTLTLNLAIEIKSGFAGRIMYGAAQTALGG